MQKEIRTSQATNAEAEEEEPGQQFKFVAILSMHSSYNAFELQ